MLSVFVEGQQSGNFLQLKQVGPNIQLELVDPAGTLKTHIGHFEEDENGKLVFVRDASNPNLVQVDADGKIVCE